MNKLLHLCAVVLLLSNTSFSQNPVSDCQYAYAVDVKSAENSTSNAGLYADIKWDFSIIGTAAQSIKIEVMPIKDCNSGVDAVRFRDQVYINVNNDNIKGSTSIGHTQISSKCFKWRVVIVAPGCNVTSQWSYYSFLSQK